MSTSDPASAGWYVLPDGTSHRPTPPNAIGRSRWEGRATPLPNGDWAWLVNFTSPLATGSVTGTARMRCDAEGRATRFARSALAAL